LNTKPLDNVRINKSWNNTKKRMRSFAEQGKIVIPPIILKPTSITNNKKGAPPK